EPPLGRDPPGELLEALRRPRVEAVDSLRDRPLVRLVRLDPLGVAARLAQRLQDVAVDPAAADRPRADQRLQQLIVLMAVVENPPPPRALGPLLRHPGQRADTGPYVAGALGVVRLRREQMQRKAARAREVRPVEVLDRQ